MKVLDLFAGLKGWSEPFEKRGHEVFTIDNDTKFDVDLHQDIGTLKINQLPWKPDIILASPPCEKFSVMTIGRNWNLDNTPKTQVAQDAMDLVSTTLELIENLSPKHWIMENPRGKLRKLPIMEGLERRTVTYCQYGEKFMKPTDLWGIFPQSLELKPTCRNGAPCHTPATRGSMTGIQGPARTKFRGGMIEDMARIYSTDPKRHELSALRAKIPYQLALDVCLAAEVDYGKEKII
jgi:hypothetical protein